MTQSDRNRLGFVSATSYVVGTIIGSGIFISPQGIVSYAGSVGLSLLIWIFSGILAIFMAFFYVEMATSIPESGGEFAYISYVGWYAIAFAFMWITTLIRGSCSSAIMCVTFGKYLLDPFKENIPDGYETLIINALAFILLFSLMVVNMFSLARFAAVVQVLSSIGKILALLFIICTGLYLLIFEGKTEQFTGGALFAGSIMEFGSIALAIFQGLWAYGGFECLTYGTEDVKMKNFKKTFPLAVCTGLTIALILQTLANVAYFVVLPPAVMKTDGAIAVMFCAHTVHAMQYVMPVIVGILMIGSLNADLFQWSRFLYAGARKRMMPTACALVNEKHDSPRVAIFVRAILAFIMILVADLEKLMNFVMFTTTLQMGAAVVALIYIKWKHVPVSPDAIKFPMFLPVLILLVALFLVIVPTIQEPLTLGLVLAATAVFFGVYFIVKTDKFRQIMAPIDDFLVKWAAYIFDCTLESTKGEPSPPGSTAVPSDENSLEASSPSILTKSVEL